MVKGFTLILILGITLIWPASLDAQVSQTTSFTLSVTVPEHAQIPSSSPIRINEPPAMMDLVHVQFQKDIREQQVVYLASYVVD